MGQAAAKLACIAAGKWGINITSGSSEDHKKTHFGNTADVLQRLKGARILKIDFS